MTDRKKIYLYPVLSTMWIKPSNIYYCQSSIDSRFHNRRNIGNVLDGICEGRLFAFNFPRIRVAKHEGKWFTIDNRRLWLFRQLERLGKCSEIPVKEISDIPEERLTTNNGGVSIYVRGYIEGSWASKPDKPEGERRRSERRPIQFLHPNERRNRFRRQRFHPFRW